MLTVRVMRSSEKGHGRIEFGAIHVHPLEGPAPIGFPHACTLLKTVRSFRETRTGKTSSETVYHLASEDHGAGTPAACAALARGHWSIENRNHWRRDACALDDKTRSKAPSVVASFAISRCALLYFNAQTESRNINAFMEANQAWYAAVFSMVTRSG